MKLSLFGILVLWAFVARAPALPPVPTPPENPITQPKRVLGKILFWDEQLSTSNAVSCGTCHQPGRGGADPRLAQNPGDDGTVGTPDDVFGAAGIISSDEINNYQRSPVFQLAPQITDRAANTNIHAAYSPLLFWDGRASGQFRDPLTNAVIIPAGGALESQALQPLLNNVEMAHAGTQWADLTSKLVRVRPLDLATNIPADVQSAINASPTYPALFEAAFGDGTVTPVRVALAIATYQRTLIADQTPFDRFRAGDANALTAGQQTGLQEFQNHSCSVCHSLVNDMTTDFSFRNIGLRPVAEDTGRQGVTGNANDRGRFKVPSLRNVGLKRTFMHNGQFQNLTQVLQFYARAPGAPQQFPDNRDPLMNQIVPLPPGDAQVIQDFIQNALTDPRVAQQTFPFDAPTLFADRPADRSTLLGGGVPGAGGVVPAILVQAPAMVGNADYRIGLFNALAGASARLGIALTPPVNGRITPTRMFDPLLTGTADATIGMATLHWPLTPDQAQGGQVLFAQWFVDDPAAVGGQALSTVARIPVFCGSRGCPSACDSIDFNNDGVFPDTLDAASLLAVYGGAPCPDEPPLGNGCNDTDFNNDGVFPDGADIEAFLRVFAGGTC
jgi:cytochrome c peroxidase